MLKDLDALYMHSLTSRVTEVDRYFLAAERIRDSLKKALPSSYRLPDLQVFADNFAGYDALIILHEKYNIRPKVGSLRTHIGIAASREVLVRSLNELTNQDLRDCVNGDSMFHEACI